MKRCHLHSEDGSVLVISIVLMGVMLMLALSSFAFVDGQTVRSKEQRQRETSLNLTEAVLYSQGFSLAQGWPGNAAAGATMPASCTSSSVQDQCPDPSTLAAGNSATPASANFTNIDASGSVSWVTRVRDNGGPIADAFLSAQVDAQQTGTNVRTGASYTCASPCTWDANGDLKLWVQARSVVRNRPRAVVALLKRERFTEAIAANGVTAGSFATTNSGNKTIIDARGSQVVVRCTSTAAACTDYQPGKNQVLPAEIVRDSSTPPAMTPRQLARFKVTAQSSSPSTYYTSCPTSLTGGVVYIDVPATTTCYDDNNAVYNSMAEPGIVIMPRGKLSLKGTFYGIVYMGNEQNDTGLVLTLEANSQIFGGVTVDGPGRLFVGQASGPRPTLTYVAHAFNSLASFGTTGLVQNTWRELPAN